MRAMRALGVALLVAGCDLEETVVADSAPFVVVESYLTAGTTPSAALHASAGDADLLVADADIRLVAQDTVVVLERIDADACLAAGFAVDSLNFPGGLACYAARHTGVTNPDSSITPGSPFEILAEEPYRLVVRMPDGSELEGTTRVPEQVFFRQPASRGCYLEPWTQVELVWNSTAGAAAYLLDLRVFGLREAFAREGIDVEIDDPLRLRGVSIGEADTTIVLPAEVGVFDRFGIDPEASVALQRGLPPGVTFSVVLAAIDENYVDWVRGGDFNPSGLIRTPSLFGDAGTGVLASLSVDDFQGTTDEGEAAARPSCSTDT